MKESGSLSRHSQDVIGKGKARSLVERIKDLYREIFLDLPGSELTLFNLRGSAL